MYNLSALALAITFAGLFATRPAIAYEPTVPEAIAARIEEQAKEGSLKKKWEGVFTRRSGFKTQALYISADAWADPLGNPPIAGKTVEKDGVICLHIEKVDNPCVRSFYLVEWDERVYLVEVCDIYGFINAVNSGGEPCEESAGRFMVRTDTLKRKPHGKPCVTKELRGFIFDVPYRAKVSSISSSRSKLDIKNYGHIEAGIEIELSTEDKRVVFEGMVLYLEDAATGYLAIVTESKDGVVRAIVPNATNFSGAIPKKGHVLSTIRKSPI